MADPAVASKRSRTHAVDGVVNAFKFEIGAAGAVGTITEWGSGDFVSGVVRTAEGIYTVTLQKPYPATLVSVAPLIASPAIGDAMVVARFDANSYSASAGTFIINTSKNTGAADTTQIAGDPANGATVQVVLHYVD